MRGADGADTPSVDGETAAALGRLAADWLSRLVGAVAPPTWAHSAFKARFAAIVVLPRTTMLRARSEELR